MRILNADSMREVDRAAIEDIGIPSLVLMENAAIGLVDALAEGYPEASSVAIFCGPGNNGGDGLALARHLTIRGYHVEVTLITAGKELSGDAAVQLEVCHKQGIAIGDLDDESSVQQVIGTAGGLDLAVDALFGTGLTRPLEGVFAEAIAAFNLLHVPRIAVDLPSGLNGSSNEIMGPHILADLTVTFGAPKVPHVLLPAAEAVGEVVVADLGIPLELIECAAGDLHLLTPEALGERLRPRPIESHKGDYGHSVVLAGSVGKSGAAILTARAAVRAGSGLVTVATPSSVVQTVDLGSIESMTLPLEEDTHGGLAVGNLDMFLDFTKAKQVVAIGPGLGTDSATAELIRGIVSACEVPIVLDADGLNAFVGDIESLAGGGAAKVLTPHPGELARLLETTTDDVQSDRVAHARSAAERAASIVVLKGAQSLVAHPEAGIFINPTGNPGMATGGSGDVLTGLIAGLISQGYSPLIAACLGVYLHGSAGDLAAQELGEPCVSADDLLRLLPVAWQRIQQ